MNPYQPSPIEKKAYSRGALERRRERRNEIIGMVATTLMFLPFEYAIVRNPPPVPKHAPGDIPLDMQRAGAPHAYINLTEFNGRFNFQLRYLSLKDDAVIAAYSFQMASDDPLKTVQFTLAFPTVPKVEDVIALELLCDGEVIGSQRIVVEKLRTEPKGTGDLRF